jgi:hypothetical protein
MDKMRLFVSIIASAAMLMVASVAGAEVTFTASASSNGGPISALNPGDLVTIDITLRSDGEAAFGVGGAAFGYDESVASYVSGTAVNAVLVQVCVPALGCFGGVDNGVIAGAGPALSLANPLGPEVQFLNAASTSGSTFTGATDQGVNGVAGSAQFQLVFQAGPAGSTTIEFGADPDYGDALIIAGGQQGVTNSAFVTLTVIPEPGTALLMGLGLAGLASARRR